MVGVASGPTIPFLRALSQRSLLWFNTSGDVVVTGIASGGRLEDDASSSASAIADDAEPTIVGSSRCSLSLQCPLPSLRLDVFLCFRGW